MNKWLWAVCAVLFAPAFCAGQNNNVRMVTYFPVPYAAYNDLEVSKNCDVGLAGSCSIKSGKKFAVVDTMKVTKGALNLNGGNIVGRTLVAGPKEYAFSADPAEIAFVRNEAKGLSGNLKVGSILNPIHILESSGQTTINGNLYLTKDYPFPICGADGHEIAWRQLDLGKGNKIYLTCGTGTCGDNAAAEEQRCQDDHGTWDSDACTCDCPDGLVWNEVTGACEEPSGGCSEEKPEDEQVICNDCGTQMLTYTCDEENDVWVGQLVGECSKTAAECGSVCGTAAQECMPGDVNWVQQCKDEWHGIMRRMSSYKTSGSACDDSMHCIPDMVTNMGAIDDVSGGGSSQTKTCTCYIHEGWQKQDCGTDCKWKQATFCECNNSSKCRGGGGGCDSKVYYMTSTYEKYDALTGEMITVCERIGHSGCLGIVDRQPC